MRCAGGAIPVAGARTTESVLIDKVKLVSTVFWGECQVILVPNSLKDSFKVALAEIQVVLWLFCMNHDTFGCVQRESSTSNDFLRRQPG
jgi:hypothetical protein